MADIEGAGGSSLPGITSGGAGTVPHSIEGAGGSSLPAFRAGGFALGEIDPRVITVGASHSKIISSELSISRVKNDR